MICDAIADSLYSTKQGDLPLWVTEKPMSQSREIFLPEKIALRVHEVQKKLLGAIEGMVWKIWVSIFTMFILPNKAIHN